MANCDLKFVAQTRVRSTMGYSDTTTRPQGKWVKGYGAYNCSNCGKIALSWNSFGKYVQFLSEFCPHCGAQMKDGEV